MKVFDYFKKKVSLHNYDSDYVNSGVDDDVDAPGDVFVEDRYEDISFSQPLSVLCHRKTELPFIDKNGHIWFFSESDHFQTALADLCGSLWETLPDELYVKVIEPSDILKYLETCYYLYGMDTASLNNDKNLIEIKKYVGDAAFRYDVSNPNYEISNPVFRYNSILYNQTLGTGYEHQDKLSRLKILFSRCAKSLFGSTLYCPYNMDGDVFSDNMVIETENGRFICIYSDAESVGDMAKDTNWRCDRLTFAEAVKKAFYQSSSMLINNGSCPIALTVDDVKFYAGELNSDVNTEDKDLDGEGLYNKALAFKSENNFSEYFRLIKKAADSDYPLAQNTLAFMYLNGDGCEKDVGEAIRYFESSLASFDSSSVALAEIYKTGNGVDADLSKALYYYKVASALGNADAMFTVGKMTLMGEGTDPNEELALSYFKKASENGNTDADTIIKAVTAGNE